MIEKPKPKPRPELFLIAAEPGGYLHDVEQSQNTPKIKKPTVLKFTEDAEKALKFPSMEKAANFKQWMTEKLGLAPEIIPASSARQISA